MPDWAIIVLIVCLLTPGVVFMLSMIRINSVNTKFPLQKLQREDLYYLEEGVSGRSYSSLLSCIGGAFKCLNVVVTRTELWVYVAGKFPVMSPGHGIHIRTPLKMLEESTISGHDRVIVQIRTIQGHPLRVSLRSRKTMSLLATLEDARRRGGDMTHLVIDERDPGATTRRAAAQ